MAKARNQGRTGLSGWVERHAAMTCICAGLAIPVPVMLSPGDHPVATAASLIAAALALAGAWLRDRASARSRFTADPEATPDPRKANRHQTTGLATREPLLAAMRADLAAGPSGGTLGVVEFVDFDRLNGFDCALADRALGTLADRVRRMIGPRRPVGQIDRARIAIWFGRECDGDTARAELDAIRYALADAIEHDGSTIIPDLRLGLAHRAAAEDTAELIVTRAIASLATGGVVMAEAEADPEAQARRAFVLEQDLRQAVTRGQLALVYQPLIDGVRQRVCGAEALMRWQHPEFGPVQPTEFIPIVEAAGLAEEIGMWAMNAACREARGWRTLGKGDLFVAVNLSAQQLHRDDLPKMIERTLARHRLPPAALEIELTETVAAGDVAHIRSLFERLRAMGVRIAIDDFGTGYSSLSYLRTLAFDKIKIDREFVSEVDTRRDSQAICQSLIALGRGLGIRVLAEGVERREEYEWLRRHGCGLFQGFLFSRPLSPADFTAFVRDSAAITRATAVSPAALQSHVIERLTA
ncbi:GGDEF domain-containing protein [Sphingomonas gilva]|uniref:GGDEF domain-containing protein n=1 Tax=Sphingomonas gilva TaxID=2305907 RepID=A0A396RRL6_9SPHN|nr:bifunctional diguanylate cyclase/phosphodiesterase [Sphingomonas gilva]RHW16953.1 GGDEF domain-containing protein [Sphingomonas gilva]